MAHLEQIRFVEKVKRMFPDYFKNKVVLDAGSLDVNGNNRFHFVDCFYIGVDLEFGKNVDLVSEIYRIPFRDGFFDVVISTEMLEHDATYYLSLKKMLNLLNKNGLMILTCATEGRPEHGTERSDPNSSPFTMKNSLTTNYYKNLKIEDLIFSLEPEKNFINYSFEINEKSKDLYFWGIKK